MVPFTKEASLDDTNFMSVGRNLPWRLQFGQTVQMVSAALMQVQQVWGEGSKMKESSDSIRGAHHERAAFHAARQVAARNLH